MRVLFFANTAWYLYNFRRSLAIALRDEGHEVIFVSPPDQYGAKLQDLGFRWIAAPMNRRSLNPFRELALVLWLGRLLKKEEIDLIHSFTVKCAIYGSLAAKLAGVKARVCAVAGMGYVFTSEDLKARILRPIVRNLMSLAFHGHGTRLILQNPDDLDLFQKASLIKDSQVSLIMGSGVNCSRFSVGGKRIAGEPLRVLLAARLLWNKGIGEYIESARILKAEGRQIQFLLAGTPDLGNPASVTERIVKAWVNEGIIEWLGHIDDMPNLLSSVNIVVLPSYYREGVPKTLIEAAACGIPLITTDMPGCREVVTHEVDGLLIPARDAKALAEAISRLEDNPELCAKFGAAARSKALALFDERIVIKRTIDVYREIIN